MESHQTLVIEFQIKSCWKKAISISKQSN